MTNREMAELFAVMMCNWPGAELFKGGKEKLGPTIRLWASSLADVDAWTAGQAVTKLLREKTFPPTIAELRQAVEDVDNEIYYMALECFINLRTRSAGYESLDDYYADLRPKGPAKQTIDCMGGVKALLRGDIWNVRGFLTAYKQNYIQALSGGSAPAGPAISDRRALQNA